MLALFIPLTVIQVASSVFGTEQTIRVSGTVICEGKRASGVTIKLMEEETLSDDKLAEIVTGPNGNFDLTGKDEEVSQIDPYLIIEHTCKAQPKKKRIVRWNVDKKYVDAPDGYNMTLVALDIFHIKETEEDL